MDRAKSAIEKLLTEADIRVNGNRPWDIRVHNERFYGAVLRGGSLAFGETYMAGWWDSDKLDELIARLLSSKVTEKIHLTPATVLLFIGSVLGNAGRKSSAFNIGRRHYDLGNDLFKRMLDKRMTYTCGYWKDANNLDEAQEAKLDLVCRKLNLKAGQEILDIGCGWGSFAKFAAEKYGARVVGTTVSKEQAELGRELCKGLPVEFRLEDYRDTKGAFDHIVSLGMFEHVGYKNYRIYMKIIRDHLKDGGLFLLHTIGNNISGTHTDPWINKYIFPNGMIPSIAQIGKAMEGLFVMEDWHNFGADYDKTLMAWFENFDRNWAEIGAEYGETFYRMWKFYLLSCAGSFRARSNQLWQIVLSKEGVRGGYRRIR
jgi:cyclopropane-fatty-acyl-phospholipid synthase